MQTQLVPLVALAWPNAQEVNEELQRLYEALAMILSESYDLLLVAPEKNLEVIRSRLIELDVPESALLFLASDESSLDLARRFDLEVKQQSDATESLDLKPKDPLMETNFSERNETAKNYEFIKAQHLVLVPIYDEAQQEDILTEVAQQFPYSEVAAINCETLMPLNLRLSDLILFSNE